MENHYFKNNPELKHQLDKWDYRLLGKSFNFYTDSGVFSKKTVDFGSRLLIESFGFSDLIAGDILDVGCGYGPMGLSFANHEPERMVEMVDVNERAIGLAIENANQNHISNVHIHLSNIYEEVEKTDFAAIISNPPIRAGKAVVHEILTGAYNHLKTGGKLVVVIQKKQGAPSAKAKMEETFGNAEIINKDKGYFIIESIKEA